jgi:hypothetical protein
MENLKPQELRIGNLIIANGAYEGQIKTYGRINESLEVLFFFDGSLYGIGEYLTDCKPILLTEEWLLKFGYTKEGSNFWNLGHIVWEYADGVFICDKNGITLKYVHQLQNLYFALTGRELTIKTEE